VNRSTRALALGALLSLVTASIVAPAVTTSAETSTSTSASATSETTSSEPDSVNLAGDEVGASAMTATDYASIATKSAKSASSVTNHEVWVSVVSATASTADDTNGAIDRAAAESLVAQMNAYWSGETNGAVTISLGGYETRSLKSAACDAPTIFSSFPEVAFDKSFAQSAWKGTNKHLLILTAESCAKAGLGSVGGNGGVLLSGNGASTSLGSSVAFHEFGHNLGFGHAGSSICDSNNHDATVSHFGNDSSACPTNEYGDYLDIMGYTLTGSAPHLSTPQRIRSGWLTDYTAISSASGSVTSTVTPLDAGSGNRALKITDPLTGAIYYIEYRTASGADATSTEFTQMQKCFTANGYSNCSRGTSTAVGSVRILRELPYRDYTDYIRTTVLAAGSTGAGETYRSTSFAAGDTFASANNGFFLTINSISPSAGASVTVRFTAPADTETSVDLGKSAKLAYGATVSATAHIATSDGSAATGTATFLNGSKVLGTAAVTAGTATLKVSSALKVGKHKISVRFTPATGDEKASVSDKKTLTVTKATSTAKISKLKRSTSKISATVTVKAAHTKTPTGKVTIYANGKKVTTYTLSASKKGVVKVSAKVSKKLAKKLAKAKTVTITAKYSGTKTVASKTSKAMRLR